MMKRGYYGTFHRMSPKHLDRYVDGDPFLAPLQHDVGHPHVGGRLAAAPVTGHRVLTFAPSTRTSACRLTPTGSTWRASNARPIALRPERGGEPLEDDEEPGSGSAGQRNCYSARSSVKRCATVRPCWSARVALIGRVQILQQQRRDLCQRLAAGNRRQVLQAYVLAARLHPALVMHPRPDARSTARTDNASTTPETARSVLARSPASVSPPPSGCRRCNAA